MLAENARRRSAKGGAAPPRVFGQKLVGVAGKRAVAPDGAPRRGGALTRAGVQAAGLTPRRLFLCLRCTGAHGAPRHLTCLGKHVSATKPPNRPHSVSGVRRPSPSLSGMYGSALRNRATPAFPASWDCLLPRSCAPALRNRARPQVPAAQALRLPRCRAPALPCRAQSQVPASSWRTLWLPSSPVLQSGHWARQRPKDGSTHRRGTVPAIFFCGGCRARAERLLRRGRGFRWRRPFCEDVPEGLQPQELLGKMMSKSLALLTGAPGAGQLAVAG